jgi:dTDP-4-dehydro-6-deoxy-alpha-D-glucopyranose 2,3-dehydratase
VSISDWIDSRREVLTGWVTPIPFSESGEWQFINERLVHRSGGFFSITARRVQHKNHFEEMLFIDQPEIGILGFLIEKTEDDVFWLLQAKAEPGTVGWVQVGPTVQATQSNYLRRHGGEATRYLEYFWTQENDLLDLGAKLQSEQGTRFWHKRNANIVRQLTGRRLNEYSHANWRWFSARDLRQALTESHLINTDSRSVIASHDWQHLRGESIIFRGNTHIGSHALDFRAAIADSYHRLNLNSTFINHQHLLDRLGQHRRHICAAPEHVSLHALKNWQITASTIEPLAANVNDSSVKMMKVHAPAREVENWDQPFLASASKGHAGLVFSRIDGVLYVLLRYSFEFGLLHGVEFGPSFQTDIVISESDRDLARACDAKEAILSIEQSDEGGRFFQMAMRYSLFDFGEATLDLPVDQYEWVDIYTLSLLCQAEGRTTNELRSLVSLMLGLA